MHIGNIGKYGKPVKIINAGEFYVSKENEIIGTLLGSCISVCLWDPEKKIGGMNHFMLPGKICKVDISKDRSARYGITAMNDLLDSMIKSGAERKRMVAKLFGGGSVFENKLKTNSIPDDNIRIARVMLELADIEILKTNVGGNFSRKILFDLDSGQVFLKKATKQKIIDEILIKEKQEFLRMQKL